MIKTGVRTITPPIVARLLRVDTETVLRWIHTGDLPALDIGTSGKVPRFRIFKKDLARFLHERARRGSRRGLSPDSMDEALEALETI